MEEQQNGYSTTTYKLRLYHKHQDWLEKTKALYNRVVKHYYEILEKEFYLLELTNFLLLRELEKLSVGTKEMKKAGEMPRYPFDEFPKIPLYFRRAAINHAISLMRNYKSLHQNWEDKKNDGKPVGKKPTKTKEFHVSPVYYKGMYKEFTDHSIQLKLYTGKRWEWVYFRYIGRAFPETGQILSPTLVIKKESTILHVPVLEYVFDIRTVKERMQTEEKICAVAFPNSDSLAVCALLDLDGNVFDLCHIKGGSQLKDRRKQLVKQLKKSQQSRKTEGKKQEEENKWIYEAIENLNSFYAHQASRRVLQYCKKNQICLIVVPNYEGAIDFSKKRYLHTDEFEWQGRKIIRYLKYKAYQNGIVVTSIRPYHIADRCSECGAWIQRYNIGHRPGRNYQGGRLFQCPNGHQGNAAENTAKNIGRYFLEHFQELSIEESSAR